MADESSPAQPPAQTTEATTSAPEESAPSSTASADKTDAGAADSASTTDAAKEDKKTEEDAKPKEEAKSQDQSAAEPPSKPTETEAESKEETTDAAANAEDGADKQAETSPEAKGDDNAAAGADDSTSQPDKSGKARRKSTAGESRAKTLKKKASKAKILNLDAKPGDHFFAKLKGFPPWPVIICAEDMLPQNMLNSRPVTAARPDGTYREDFADGGKRAADRTFPVMYLYTNEFSWTPNTDLSELDPETVGDLVTSKMRKDLQKAHELAAENNNLEYYQNLLISFEEAREEARLEKAEKAEAKAAAAAEKKAKAAAKSSKGSRKSKSGVDEDGDMEMEDVDDEVDSGSKAKAKKRKAEDATETPSRSDSVKKPKIKLTSSSTPKTANGVVSPRDSASKTLKVKAKPKKVEAPKEPELSPEEKKERKQKEILFLRHRLQKGLLNRTAPPKEEEMKSMSEFLGKLETFPDLEADIIKTTKINKVLKAMLKLDSIPKDEEFKFTSRSKTLLDKWQKILEAAEGSAPKTSNGVNGEAKGDASNGVKEASADAADKNGSDAKATDTEKAAKAEDATKVESAPAAADVDETSDEVKPTSETTAAATVESTA